MKKILFLSLALAIAGFSTARADVSGSGAGIAIPDNDPLGASSTIVIGASETITGGASFTLQGMTHTWVGDIAATIIAPDLSSTTLVFEIEDTTGPGVGDSSDFGGDYTFTDSATGDIWAEAAAQAGAGVVTPGSYRSTGPLSGTFTSLDAFFNGKNTAGTWTLFMTDGAGGDVGGITGWTLSFNSTGIPEPTSALLLAGMGLVGLTIRRRR